jgi:hypothetical protein
VPRRLALAPGDSRRVVLRLTRAGGRLLRHRNSLALTLVGRAVDGAGNSRRLKVAVSVSRR